MDRQQLEAAIVQLDAQRAALGDDVVDAAILSLRQKLDGHAPPSVSSQALKQVTVLVTDVVGSTALGEQLDPEEIHEVMDGALQRFSAIVAAHRGKVLQYAGDSLLAVFGAEQSHEDDAERAMRAGLSILDEAGEFASRVQERYGHADFNVRIGAHTGTALLGGGVDAEGSIRGLMVSVAARMEQTAPIGGFRISHEVYAQVRGIFDVAEQAPLRVKGVTEPVRTYLVLRAKPRAFRLPNRGIEGVETPMVGRDAQLLQLTSAFGKLIEQRRLHAVTVVAEAGLGKSRLLTEFQSRLDLDAQTVWLLLARADETSRLRPYGLLRDVLARRFDMADDEPADAARQKLLDGLATTLGPDAKARGDAQALGHLIGLDFSSSPGVRAMLNDPRQLRDRAFKVVITWLRQLVASDGSPVVLLLDDVHWADDGSLDFIVHLMQQHRDIPMLLLLFTRPELFERRPMWAAATDRHGRIDLSPLDVSHSRQLVEALLNRLNEVPATLRELLITAAEGNPFYIEELVKMLIDEGVIETAAPSTGITDGALPSAWRLVPGKFFPAKVPTTLTGVLQARLDALGQLERTALQHASVVGSVFWDQALAAIDPQATESLPALQRKKAVLAYDRSVFEDSREFGFCHHLLHQVTYESVLKPARREAHARAAAWLVGRERSGEHLAAVAEHLARAGNRAEAATCFERAAGEAAVRYANSEAIEHARRGLALTDPADLDLRWQLLGRSATSLDILGRREEQQATLDDMEALSIQSNDPKRKAHVALHRALLADRRGDFDLATHHAREAIVLAEAAGMWKEAAKAHGELAFVLTLRGEHSIAREQADLGLSLAARSGDAPTEAQLLAVAANLEESCGEYSKAIELMGQSIDLARRLESRRTECLVRGNLGTVLSDIGDHEGALAQQQASLSISREIENRYSEATALISLSRLTLEQGGSKDALAQAHEAAEIMTAIGDRFNLARAQVAAAAALAARGSLDEAAVAYGRAREVLDAAGTSAEALQPIAGLASLALDTGQLDRARQLADELLHRIEGGAVPEHSEALRIHLIVYRILAAANDPRAPTLLQTAHDALQKQLARIPDLEWRARYRQRVAHARDIERLWQAAQTQATTKSGQ